MCAASEGSKQGKGKPSADLVFEVMRLMRGKPKPLTAYKRLGREAFDGTGVVTYEEAAEMLRDAALDGQHYRASSILDAMGRSGRNGLIIVPDATEEQFRIFAYSNSRSYFGAAGLTLAMQELSAHRIDGGNTCYAIRDICDVARVLGIDPHNPLASVPPSELERLWEELSGVPVDGDNKLVGDWQAWDAGTDRKSIWRAFGRGYDGGLIELMDKTSRQGADGDGEETPAGEPA